MTDDPWKTPDPNAPKPPPPPPQYPPQQYPAQYPQQPQYPQQGPPPGYGPPVYAPPGGYAPVGYGGYDPNNPYGAPLPKRGGIKRLVWILSTVGVLVLGGCGVGIYFIATTLTKNADEVNAFLRNVRDHQFTTAYDRLCPGVKVDQSLSVFSSSLQAAVDRGHGVTSFDINRTNTDAGTDGSSRSAGGEVDFADGEARSLTFYLGKVDGKLCVASGYTALE